MNKSDMNLAERASRLTLLNREQPVKAAVEMLQNQLEIEELKQEYRIAMRCLAILIHPSTRTMGIESDDDCHWVLLTGQEFEEAGGKQGAIKIARDLENGIDACFPVRVEVPRMKEKNNG